MIASILSLVGPIVIGLYAAWGLLRMLFGQCGGAR